MAAVEVTHVFKSFGETRAVQDVSFSAHPGEILGLLGPNGAGKTTLLRMILDIYKPERGQIAVLGGPIDEQRKNRIGYLPEERGLYQDLSLERVLIYLAALKGVPHEVARRRLGEYLEMFDLNDGRPEESIPLFEKAIRLNPLGPASFYQGFAVALRDTGRLEEAVASYIKALVRAPNNFRTHALLAGVYSMMGRDKEARAEAAEVLRINPKFSLEWYAGTLVYKDRSVTDRIIIDMRKAGLTDKPPPAQP